MYNLHVFVMCFISNKTHIVNYFQNKTTVIPAGFTSIRQTKYQYELARFIFAMFR